MGIRLSEEEAWAVIERSHTGMLTTLRTDGAPITLPVWFVALDRSICFSTPDRIKKVARIRRDPRASFLVESGEHWAELCGVHLSGRADEVGDGPTRQRIAGALDMKYAAFRTAQEAMPEATRQHYSDRSFFRLVPAGRMLTWDNRRISLGS